MDLKRYCLLRASQSLSIEAMGLSCSSPSISPPTCILYRRVNSSSTLEVSLDRSNFSNTETPLHFTDANLLQLAEVDSLDYNKYLNRISTFFNDDGVNHHWLSKPPALSPPNCAIFGWRLTSCNMLTCELCGAKLFAEVSSKLPSHIVRKCLKEIERNLRSGHTKACTFRLAPCPDSFRYVSLPPAALVAAFDRRLATLDILREDVPCVTFDEFEELDTVKRNSTLREIPTELVILALLGWEHHSTSYKKFHFIRCGFCFRKVCTMFYRKLTREEEQLVEEAEQRIREESGAAASSESLLTGEGAVCSESAGSCPVQPATGAFPVRLGESLGERKRRSLANAPNPGGGSFISGSPNRKELVDGSAYQSAGSDSHAAIRALGGGGPQISKRRRRRPHDQLNPLYEHRSWCAWVCKANRLSLCGWRILLEVLVAHQRQQQHFHETRRAPAAELHENAIEAAEKALENLRRKSDHWREKESCNAASNAAGVRPGEVAATNLSCGGATTAGRLSLSDDSDTSRPSALMSSVASSANASPGPSHQAPASSNETAYTTEERRHFASRVVSFQTV